MSHEHVGALRTSMHGSRITYNRSQRGITLPYDNMTKEERNLLNGDIKTYHIDDLEDENKCESHL